MRAAHSELAMRYQATPVLRNNISCFSLFPRRERVPVFCGQNTHCFLPEWVLSGKERKAGPGRSSLGRMALVQLSPWRRELFFLEQRRKKGIQAESLRASYLWTTRGIYIPTYSASLHDPKGIHCHGTDRKQSQRLGHQNLIHIYGYLQS